VYADLRFVKPDQQIRVLEILPGPGEDKILCTLATVHFEQQKMFEALSYAWGDSQERKTIQVNGLEMQVTTNLESALRHLRLPDLPRVLWVDAVCINQCDVEEKAVQVALMGKIYRGAEKVVIFLGPDDESSSFLFDFLDMNPSRDLEKKIYLGVDELQLAKAILKFFQRAWWARAWIRQEYALSKNEPLFICGRSSTTASDLEQLTRNLGNHVLYVTGQSPREVLEGGTYREMKNKLMMCLDILRLRSDGPTNSWKHLLLDTTLMRTCQATDDRDRIYSIRELTGPIFPLVFRPNYIIPLPKLLTKATIWVLTMEDFGDVWAFFPLLSDESQPSWTFV
jgi:hypothetical protein